jgi:hypothetical protein
VSSPNLRTDTLRNEIKLQQKDPFSYFPSFLTSFVLSNKQFLLRPSISCHLHEGFNFGQRRICKALRTLCELSENRLGISPMLISTSRTFHQRRGIMLLQSLEPHWGHLQKVQELRSNRGTQGVKRSPPELHAVGNTGKKHSFRAEAHPCLDQGRMQSQSLPSSNGRDQWPGRLITERLQQSTERGSESDLAKRQA